MNENSQILIYTLKKKSDAVDGWRAVAQRPYAKEPTKHTYHW